MRKIVRGAIVGTALAGLCGVVALATDEPDELVHGKLLVVKQGILAKVIGKPLTAGSLDLPNASNDPTLEGGSLRIRDSGGGGAGLNTYPLNVQVAPLGWKGLGSPAGSKGYKYKGAGSAGDPCKVVLVKEKIIKAVCKGAGVTLNPPFTGDANIIFTVGTTSKRYCLKFGLTNSTTIKNTDTITIRKGSETAACASPSGAFIEMDGSLF